MNKPTILVVEDDSSVRSLITTTLKAHGYKIPDSGQRRDGCDDGVQP